MTAAFGSQPADLVAAVGPAIGPCCYEVGADVAAAMHASQADAAGLLAPGPRPDAWMLDLWQANARQLLDAGVGLVEVAGLCTCCRRDVFFSHRGDDGRTGRFAAFIQLV